MDTWAFVSVIILNWNGRRLLRDCLSSLVTQTYPNYELILVDNGSTDDSVEYVHVNFPRVKIVSNAENLGFSRGNNVGFSNARGKYLVVVNNDTKAESNLIEELVRIAEADQSVGSVGCKILQLDGTIGYGPVFMLRGFIHRFTSTNTVQTFGRNLANCACVALYRRSLIEKLGGFDPYFWANWEDHDLGYRINLAGFKSVLTPSTSIIHIGAATHRGLPPERTAKVVRNMLFCYFKNYETKNLVTLFPRLVLILAIKWITLPYINELSKILKMHGKARQHPQGVEVGRTELRSWYGAFPTGLGLFLRGLKPIMAERTEVQRLRTVPDKNIFKNTDEKNASTLNRWLRVGF